EGGKFPAKLGRHASRDREAAFGIRCNNKHRRRPGLDPGPILRGLSVKTLALETFYNNEHHAVWVPDAQLRI
ncbi:hypothetical protein, partial [Bradyrhizobium sp. AUGA SZCCT0274]|uniref:hypothetical protein n=1 Tax=Bradyrhizobium sp. AUGA SZCCT0274 TaxID=2807670 RepID=UPI001BAD4E3E